MTTRAFTRLGPACGVFSSIALLVLPQHHLRPLHLAAFVLVLPFLAYLCSLFRESEGAGGWLSSTAFGAGVAGISIKLVSVTAIARDTSPTGTQLHKALDGIAGAATVISLYPLAISLAAIALLTLRTGVLPRLLGLFAGGTAVALLVNGSFLHTEFMPALLLFVFWTLAASLILLRRTWREPASVTQANPAPAA